MDASDKTRAYLVSVPPQTLVRKTGRTRETLEQLVGKKHLPLFFVVCTQRHGIS